MILPPEQHKLRSKLARPTVLSLSGNWMVPRVKGTSVATSVRTLAVTLVTSAGTSVGTSVGTQAATLAVTLVVRLIVASTETSIVARDGMAAKRPTEPD